jgi:hypothetical protein
MKTLQKLLQINGKVVFIVHDFNHKYYLRLKIQ